MQHRVTLILFFFFLSFDPRKQRKGEQRGDFLGKDLLSYPPEPLNVCLKDISAFQGKWILFHLYGHSSSQSLSLRITVSGQQVGPETAGNHGKC